MASQISRLVSHQGYSCYDTERRLIEVNVEAAQEALITHYIDFTVSDDFFALVKYHRPDLTWSPVTKVRDYQIYYVAERKNITYTGIPKNDAAVPLNRCDINKIIHQLGERTLAVADIYLDTQSGGRRTYILLAPTAEIPSDPIIRQTPAVRKQPLSCSQDASLDTPVKRSLGSSSPDASLNATPTPYQEIQEI
jgi:hypothetical protein